MAETVAQLSEPPFAAEGRGTEAAKTDQLLRALHGLSQLRQGHCITEVHFIGFSRIQDILGQTWQRLRHRILPMIQQWIESELGGGDTVLILGDGFCILYARLRGAEAEAKTAALEKAVSARLFGSEAKVGLSDESSTVQNVEEPPANTAMALRAQAPEVEIAAKATEVSCSYLPMWSPTRRAVNVFSCVPKRNSLQRAHYFEPPEDGPDFDRALLNNALENILELHANHDTCFVIASFNFNSLNRPKNRRPYELMFREIPKELRGFFIARIVRLPPGVPSMSIPPAIALLRGFFPRVFVHVSLGDHDLDIYGAGGVGGAGLSLRPPKVADWKLPDSQTLARFVATAKRFKMPAYIEGVTTPAELTLCREAGFDLIGGGLISNPLKKPLKTYKLDEETIVSGRDGREWVIE